MTYKLLYVKDITLPTANIGDYIQALAASQFLPHVDGFVNREQLKSYEEDECKIIMNGWYMHNTHQWPPSPKIHPLFVSVHFNSTAKQALFSKESLNYLKKYEPIGCRDTQTRDMLIEHGIRAYFSGCLTLTLGYKYKSQKKTDKIYFVDPYFITHWDIKMVIKNALYLLLNYSAIKIISEKHPEPKKGLRKKMILTTFYREYKKYFSKETLLNAEYICQQSIFYKEQIASEEARILEAERLVTLYSKAKFVVTSRIHCALPCLGLDTTVIFTENKQQTEVSSCRFGGLKDFFNVLSWDKDHLVAMFDYEGSIMDIQNKSIHKDYANKLRDLCINWVREDK